MSDHEYRTGGMEIAKYSPNQPRDRFGRWTHGHSVEALGAAGPRNGKRLAPFTPEGTTMRDIFENMSNRGTKLLVSRYPNSNQISGYVEYHDWHDEQLTVKNIRATDSHTSGLPRRGEKGAGRALMSEMARMADERGLRLSVDGAVYDAKPFYAAMGGRVSSNSSNVDWSHVDTEALAAGMPRDRRPDREWEKATWDTEPWKDVDLPKVIQKYAPGQARDNRGRFSSGGGSSSYFDPATSVRSVDNEWATKQRAKMDTAAGYGGVRYGNPYTEGTPEQEAEWAKHPDVVAHKMGALADLRQQADREAQIAKAQAYVNESPLAIRMHDSTLMLRDGRYKSQFETGTSGGALSLALRADAEADMFGFPVDMPVDQRPAYGYLERATEVGGYMGSGAVSQYGSDRIILKDSVRPRTTITGEDSLGRKFVPAPVNAVDEYALSRRKGDLLAGIKQSQSVNYIEIQVHGGVKVSDVARVDMSLPDYTLRTEGGKRLLEEKRATAAGWEAAGVPAYVNGERVVPVQKYAPSQPRDERGRFSTTTGGGGTRSYRSVIPQLTSAEAGDMLSEADHREVTTHVLENISKVHSIPDTGQELHVVAYDSKDYERLGEAEGFYQPTDPGAINVYAGAERPTYVLTHEFGHLIDAEFIGGDSREGSIYGVMDFDRGGYEHEALRDAIKNSDSMVGWQDRADNDADSYWKYIADPPEVFARAYAQYIGVRSGDPILLDDLANENETHWEADEFVPIADAFDKFFAARGMGPNDSVQKYAPGQPRDDRGRFADTAGGSFDVEQLGFRNVTAFGEPLDPRLTASMERIATVHRTPEVMAVPEVYDTNELWLSWDTNMSGEGTLAPNVMGAYEAPADGRKGRIHMNKESLGVGSPDADARMRVYAQHEYGHALDNLALGLGSGKYGSTNIGRRPDMEPLVMAIEATPAFKAIKHDDYYGQRPEAFARAYTQWIATRSGDKAALAWMEPRFDQWSAEEFAPIAAEFDTLFRGRGWLIED